MEVKLRKEDFDNNKSLVEIVCENRGIDFTNIEEFCDPTNINIQNPFKYTNMEKAIDRYMSAINNKECIGILVDSDTDGYCSASTLVQVTLSFFRNENICVFMHNNKAHGLTSEVMNKILNSEIDLLIIADASSNDFKQHEVLKHNNIDIIILDHHEADRYSESAIVVNNQLQEGVNKNLCGMGVVQKFLEAIQIKFGHIVSEYFLDLTAVSLVADCMNMTSLENRYYVSKGLNNLNNKLLIELFSQNKARDYQTISFDIAPTINAFIRVADFEEKMDLFFALCGINQNRKISIRGLGEMEVNLQEYIKRMASRIKSRQNKLINEIITNDNLQIINDGIPFSIIILPNQANKNLTGLIASRFVEKFKKPSLVLKQNEDYYGGSARTIEGFKNFKNYIKATNLFHLAEGHQEAFGVSITWENILKLIKKMNGLEDIKSCILVDRIYDNNLFPFDVLSIGELEHQWSRGFEEPRFLVKINTNNINDLKVVGNKKDTVRFKFNNITFIKFKCDESDIIKLSKSDEVRAESDEVIEIVCKFKMNEWNGNYYPQCEIENYEFYKYNIEFIQNPFQLSV